MGCRGPCFLGVFQKAMVFQNADSHFEQRCSASLLWICWLKAERAIFQAALRFGAKRLLKSKVSLFLLVAGGERAFKPGDS